MFRSFWRKPGTPRVVRAIEPGASERRDRPGGTFAPVPWSGTARPGREVSVRWRGALSRLFGTGRCISPVTPKEVSDPAAFPSTLKCNWRVGDG